MTYVMEVLWWMSLGVAGGLVTGVLCRPAVLRARARQRSRKSTGGV